MLILPRLPCGKKERRQKRFLFFEEAISLAFILKIEIYTIISVSIGDFRLKNLFLANLDIPISHLLLIFPSV